MPAWSTLTRALSRTLLYRAPLEAEQCPACASRQLTDIDLFELRNPVQDHRHGFVTLCETCGLVFTNPLPTAEALTRFYSPEGDWGSRRLEAHGAPKAAGGAAWSRMFDPVRGDLSVTTPLPGDRVLDFGCGEGRLLDQMQDAGWDTYGIEPSFDRAFVRHRRLETIPNEATFDVIVANHVLEHMTNPLEILRALAVAARPGAYLVVGVPRLDTLAEHHDYKYVVNGSAHVTAYTWSCLQGLLLRAGWEAVAAPAASVSAGKRGHTTARMRVVSRRVAERLPAPRGQAEPAREAVAAHLRSLPHRSWLLRRQFFRLEAHRQQVGRELTRRTRALRSRVRLRSRFQTLLRG